LYDILEVRRTETMQVVKTKEERIMFFLETSLLNEEFTAHNLAVEIAERFSFYSNIRKHLTFKIYNP
jgi:hypothetical protein